MVLEVKGLHKSFQDNKVLEDVSFKLNEGEITAIIGHSGAGKTTLLRCLNALDLCDGGSIKIDETYLCSELDGKTQYATKAAMKDIRKKLGMVFQNLNLFPHKSVLENLVEAPINVFNIPKQEAVNKAHELLTLLGIKDKAEMYPYQLSGGQKQRVAIARACVLSPSIMCFDEPTSALDPELRESIAEIIEKLASEGMAILVITHDISFAKRVAQKVLFMDAGKIIQQGTQKEFWIQPQNDQVRRFINSV